MEGSADVTFYPLTGNSITKELFLNTVGCGLVFTMPDNMVLFVRASSSLLKMSHFDVTLEILCFDHTENLNSSTDVTVLHVLHDSYIKKIATTYSFTAQTHVPHSLTSYLANFVFMLTAHAQF